MGSAFYAGPTYGIDPRELVLFGMFVRDEWADWIVHMQHPECAIECPHQMKDCGRFLASDEQAEGQR